MGPIAPLDAVHVAATGTVDAGMPAGIVGGGAPDHMHGVDGMHSPLARRILSQGRTSRLTERVTMGAGASPDLAEFRHGQQRGDRRPRVTMSWSGDEMWTWKDPYTFLS